MTRISGLTLTAALLAAVAASNPEAARQEDARVLRGGGGTPIRELIANQEARLTLEWAQLPPDYVAPLPGVDLLEWNVQWADLILLADVVAGSPRLTERADFIVTDWIARVARVFKQPNDSWTAGRDVTFTTSGGTMKVEGTVVDAVVPWALPIQVGGRYLIFTETTVDLGDGSIEVSPVAMYEFVGLNTIRRLFPRGGSDALEASFQAEVVTRLEELTGAR